MAPPLLKLETEVASAVRELIEQRLAEGFDDRRVLVTGAVETFSDSAPAAVLKPAVESMVDRAAKETAAKRLNWPQTTDCDRLDKAFEALRASGLLAFQHFWCCEACAARELVAMYAEGLEATPRIESRGYVYYHAMDTERAAASGELFISFGSHLDLEDRETSDRVERAVAIGTEVVEALAAAGLNTSWEGDEESPIEVQIDWKRRGAPQGWTNWRTFEDMGDASK